jgi:hypothetical protein
MKPQVGSTKIPVSSVVTGLAWFSIGLGLAELLAPRRVSKAAGMTKHNALLRGYGLREIATGVGLLTAKNPKPWLWGRVAGDVIDMATVAGTANTRRPGRLSGTFAALLGVGLLDLYAALKAGPSRGAPRRNPQASGRDYSNRSGFPKDPEAMRGAASSHRHEMGTGRKQHLRAAE